MVCIVYDGGPVPEGHLTHNDRWRSSIYHSVLDLGQVTMWAFDRGQATGGDT